MLQHTAPEGCAVTGCRNQELPALEVDASIVIWERAVLDGAIDDIKDNVAAGAVSGLGRLLRYA